MRKLVTDTLKALNLYSAEAVELMLGTAAQESAYGKYRRQLGNGPALGIFQMEPNTFYDICINFLAYKPELRAKILKVSGIEKLDAKDLETNDVLATCMCRVHYYRVKTPVPVDLQGWAGYWKQYYNTQHGKGTDVEFIRNYNKYVEPLVLT
jgi:hypothetical protein